MSLHRLCCCEEGELAPCCLTSAPSAGCTRNPAVTEAQRRMIYQWEFTKTTSRQVVGGAAPTVLASTVGEATASLPWNALPAEWNVQECGFQRDPLSAVEGDDYPVGFNYQCPNGPVLFTSFDQIEGTLELIAQIGLHFDLRFNSNFGLSFEYRVAKHPVTGDVYYPLASANFSTFPGVPSVLTPGTEVIPTLVSADLCPFHFRLDINATRTSQANQGGCLIERIDTVVGFARFQVTGIIDCQDA